MNRLQAENTVNNSVGNDLPEQNTQSTEQVQSNRMSRVLSILLAAQVLLPNADDDQRIRIFMNVVETIITKSFMDDQQHQEFLYWLRSKMTEYGI